MSKEIKPEVKLDDKKDECVAKITAILEEYGYDLAVVGFQLVPKK